MDLVNHYAAALSMHPAPVEAAGEVAGAILERFGAQRPDLVVCFASADHRGAFEDMTAVLRKLCDPEVLVGCTVAGVAGGGREVEQGPALSVFAARFGAGHATGFALDAVRTSDGFEILGWPDALPPAGTLMLLADPFTFPVPDFLALANARLPGVTVVGGLASAAGGPGGNRLVWDDQVVESGAVAVLLSGDVGVRTVVSQGCRPIGQPLTVTRAERNLVYELGGRPALERLQELVMAADDHERELMRQGLHVGIVVDEHRHDFHRGDFLVRNLLGADQRQGALAVGEQVQVGQTLQFQVRDAASASEDLRALLAPVAGDAALLFTCNGRGSHLFGEPGHDAATIEELLGTVPTAGAFCAGEIGPVGGRSYLHGFTASVAVFGR
jgi:small ligand-binding sensory domain FIST